MALEAQFVSLSQHAEKLKDTTLRDLFANDPARFTAFSAKTDDLLLDYSKSIIDADALAQLVDLAKAADVEGRRTAMFSGEKSTARKIGLCCTRPCATGRTIQ